MKTCFDFEYFGSNCLNQEKILWTKYFCKTDISINVVKHGFLLIS